MRKQVVLVITALIFTLFTSSAFAQTEEKTAEYKVVTVIESIVPMGLGRSRIIETQSARSAEDFSTERTEGTDSKQGKVRRHDAKVNKLKETKLLNFYSLTGINLQNIASNDALIASKLTDLAAEGWKLLHTVSGVESDSGESDGQGIFITRFIFTR